MVLVDETRLTILDQVTFVRVVNALLRAEASALGIPQTSVDTTVAITAPDGGVDCRVTPPSGAMTSQWIPDGVSVWQVKSGRAPTIPQLRKELAKPEVTAAFDQGHDYRLVVSASLTSARKGRLLEEIRKEYAARNLPAKGAVLSAAEAARWLSDQLGVASAHLLGPIGSIVAFNRWSENRRFRNQFFSDGGRADIISAVRDGVARRDRVIRILGYAGMGKTRTVLEALRVQGLQERVLYWGDASLLSEEFVWHLREMSPGAQLILVLDECTADIWPMVERILGGLPDGCSSVVITPQDHAGGRHALELGRLRDPELAKILQNYLPSFPEALCRAIAQRCGGAPKLAVLLGEVLARQGPGSAGWEAVESVVDVSGYLNAKVFPLNSVEPDARLMRGLSLFTSVGWYDDMSQEGRAVAQFAGLDWSIAQAAAISLVNIGVLSRRGRLIYPTPDILANVLTRETMRLGDLAAVRLLLRQLPERGRNAFADRLRQLGEGPETAAIAREVLGGAEFFRSLTDLDDPSLARVLRSLAASFPSMIVTRLKAIFEAASDAQVLAFRQGRRELVWALEELAWWQAHFRDAALVLLRLAVSENESIDNNASGVWCRLFQISLGGTEVPFPERLSLLSEVMTSSHVGRRVLATKALGAALRTQHIHRMGGVPHDTSRLPPVEWRPGTYEEWRQHLVSCLVLLESALHDDVDAVRESAMDVLAQRGSDLLAAGLGQEWASRARSLVNEPFERRAPLLGVIRWRLQREEPLPEEVSSSLAEAATLLAGTSFGDRLRRIAGPWDADRQEQHLPIPRLTVEQLATEIVAEPGRLEEQVDWLFSGEANSGYRLGVAMGREDANAALLPMLRGAYGQRGSDDRVLSGYLDGGAQLRGMEWLENLMDDWSASPSDAELIELVTWRVVHTTRAATRLTELLLRGWLYAERIANLPIGFWSRDLGASTLRDLLEAALVDQSPRPAGAVVAIIHQYIGEHPEALPELAPAAWQALERSASAQGLPMEAYSWQRLAMELVGLDPGRVARACVHAMSARDATANDSDTRQVLRRALANGGWEVFANVIGPALLADPNLLWSIDSPFGERWLFVEVDLDQLITWIQADVESRLPMVAAAVPVGIDALPSVTRAILKQWGDREDVRRLLWASTVTGLWSGPESARFRDQVEAATRWASDEDPHVRRFAGEIIEYHTLRLERAMQSEAEETG